ncbi:MAG: ribonuclease H-like domain-containing protein [Patescibacteria group bacterium]
MDKIVIDIETKNTFADVGGQENIKDLQVSFVGLYSYNKDQYLSFYENELDKLGPILKNAGLVIGFSINRFDIPVLEKHCDFNIYALSRLDLLEEIEMALGHRISLDILAKTNLGIGKTHHSLEAIKLYKDGNLEELKNYCLNDVKITKDLYELAKKNGHLLVPSKTSPAFAKASSGKPEILKARFNWREQILPSTLF